MANIKIGALLLIHLFGFGEWCSAQTPQDPLPEPIASPLSDVALTPPDVELPPIPERDFTPPRPAIAPPAEAPAPAEPAVPRWNFHVRLETSLTYDDNIFIQPREKQADFYFGITPVIAVGWGRFQADPSTVTGLSSRFPQVAARNIAGNLFLFHYAPTAEIFVHRSDQNTVNQDVSLAGRWIGSKLTLDTAARFEKLTAPDIDVGDRIESTVTSAFLNANYQFTEKTSLDSRFAFEHDSYQNGLDSSDFSLATLLNYQILPKTVVGLGVGGGYTTVEGGREQYYEQGLLHFRYDPTFKLSFDGTVGAEVRQIHGGPDHVTPVVEFAATYAAQDSTTIRLSVSRRTEASALFGEQDIERTTVEGSVRQRFWQKAYISLSGGYQHIKYVDAGSAANRDDNYAYFGVETSMEVTRWLSARASYRHEENTSSSDDFSFRRNLVELQVNYQF